MTRGPALAEAVREGLRTAAGSGRVASVESLTKGGVLVAYEAIVEGEAGRAEIQVGPNDAPLAQRQ